MAELRRFRRVNKDLVVSVKELHVDQDKVRTFESVTRNLGEGGLFIETQDPPAKGTILEVQFDLPGAAERIRTLAQVRWSDANAKPPGMGVRIARIDPDARDAMASFLHASSDKVERDSRELEAILGDDT